MPLPESPQRTELHLRQIEIRGYRREDGLYEIDGRVVDTKSDRIVVDDQTVREPGQPIHDMWMRLVVDENLVIKDVVAVTDSRPYLACSQTIEPMRKIVGERIKAGWTQMVKSRLG